jgi:hypothetical protein
MGVIDNPEQVRAAIVRIRKALILNRQPERSDLEVVLEAADAAQASCKEHVTTA